MPSKLQYNLCHRHHRRVVGFTMMETLAAIAVLSVALLFTIQAILTTARVSSSMTTYATFQDKSRGSLDMLSQDVASSYWTMAQYPPTGTATYTADCSKTLILCTPQIKDDNTPVTVVTGTPDTPVNSPLNYDYIIYRVIQPSTANMAADGPWEMVRQVIPGPSSARPAVTTIVAKNIPNDPTDSTNSRPWVSISYLATQAFPGTTSTCVNLVTTVCTLATSVSAPTPSVSTTEVLANGVDKSLLTVFAANLMTITPAIATPTPPNPTPSGYTTPNYINVRYSVNPATLDTQMSPSNGRNYAGQIIFTMHQTGVTESGNTISASTIPTSVMTTAATLRNRPALQ